MPMSSIMKRLHAPVYASRLRKLVSAIAPHLHEGDRVLDVGCGGGALGSALVEARAGVRVEGLERFPRSGVLIPCTGYAGGPFPFGDDAFDVTIAADVIHHEPDPPMLLRELSRVARRLVIVKDHHPGGPAVTLPRARIMLMDWAANAPHGVKCLYDYPTAVGWRQRFNDAGLTVVEERAAMPLYPAPYRFVFTKGLQYFAVLKKGR